MTGSRLRPAIFVGLFLGLLAISLQGVQGEEEELDPVPSEDLCRPYIEKALKDLGTGSLEQTSAEVEGGANEDGLGKEVSNEQGHESTSKEDEGDKTEGSQEGDQDSGGDGKIVEVISEESQGPNDESGEKQENDSAENADAEKADDDSNSNEDEQKDASEGDDKSGEKDDEGSVEVNVENSKEGSEDSKEAAEGEDSKADSEKDSKESAEAEVDSENDKGEESEEKKDDAGDLKVDEDDSNDADEVKSKSKEEDAQEDKSAAASAEDTGETESVEKDGKSEEDGDGKSEADAESKEDDGTKEAADESKDDSQDQEAKDVSKEEKDSEEVESRGRREAGDEGDSEGEKSQEKTKDDSKDDEDASEEAESMPEEELIQEIEVPENLRPRDHINQLLKLDEDNEVKEKAIEKAADVILRDLKKLYDNAIQPLETLYKYRDLSNRHFGDPEIFSKPLVLFMGPWSGGKSSIINYLLDIEYKPTSLRTGAEPSPAYFNILMHGEEEEVLDGTQLAADWTFSGLQKFGQGMLDRLRGLRLNNKLLEKVNIVEIPGILEIRKQVQRLFPFNDACQWFIDRADIIFLVYDPSKLDVGPETEAILDQLKGREYQTRIILNKADQVKPEELMRVQGALIWNISPLMSSAEPPIMYSTSLWSMPYEAGAPTRLLYAQERAFLRDLRSAVEKRVEHKIASARRFAVRVRNHAKMVDCYLTTYYNHKTFFGNKKEISDKIIENPQDYHIYEGLSTLTNISRYDLPDPDVYRDFFRLNSLYEFTLLSTTCTYFRGCPINRLDVAIAYDLPELVGKYRKSVEAALHEGEANSPPS